MEDFPYWEETFHSQDKTSDINPNPYPFKHVHAYVHDDLHAGINNHEAGCLGGGGTKRK